MFSKVVRNPLTSYRSTMVLHLSLTSLNSCQHHGELYDFFKEIRPFKLGLYLIYKSFPVQKSEKM